MANLFWYVILFFISLSFFNHKKYQYFENVYNYWLMLYKLKSEEYFTVKTVGEKNEKTKM